MKNRIKVLTLVLVGICVIVASLPFIGTFAKELDAQVANGSTNLLVNGSFDSDDAIGNIEAGSGNSVLTKGWKTNYVKNTEFTISNDSNTGKNSLKIEHSSASEYTLKPTVADVDGMITGLEKGVYKFSFYAKGDGNLKVKYRDVTVTEEQYKAIELTESFTKYTIDTLYVGDLGNLILEFCGAAESGSVYIDDVSLTKNTAIINGGFEDKSGFEYTGNIVEFGPGNNSAYTYVNTNNKLRNSGFEASTKAQNTSKNWEYITEEWYAAGAVSSSKFSIALSDDSHSGKNSLKITGTENQGTIEIRIFNGEANPTSAASGGITSGYLPNTEYIVSYWAKGDAKTRVFAKYYDGSSWQNNWGGEFTPSGSDWQLNTHKIKSDASGNIWWNLYFCGNQSGKTSYIDDVSVLSVSDMAANVDAMIEALDMTSSTAIRLVADINAWISVLGKSKLTKYDLFLEKIGESPSEEEPVYTYVNTKNNLENSSFEDSTGAKNTASGWSEITADWQAEGAVKSASFELSISNDAHSGSNSFKITSKAADSMRLFNGIADGTNATLKGITSGYAANTDYIVSYWVKGDAATRVFAKNYNGSSWENNWDAKFTPAGSGWELNTHKIKSNSAGEVWWNVYFVENQSGKTAYIDDVSILTEAQAVENVNAMITALDVNSPTASQLIADINAWYGALNNNSAINYATFQKKVNGYNLLTNAGFESSTSVTQKHADWYEMTTGWKTSWASSSKFTLNISTDEAHSGSKSFKVDVLDNGELAITTSTATYDSTAGAMIATGYDPTEEYIVSYWYKGSAITRFRTYTGADNAAWSNSWRAETTPNANEWQLNTQKLTPTASGKLSWLIYIKSKGKTAYIDDISLTTVTDAKASVNEMITALDMSSDTVAQDVAVIKAWVKALGEANVSNYALFQQKLKNGGLVLNSGFEYSTKAQNTSVNWAQITEGWTSSSGVSSGKFSLDISNDAHSGKNSLKITATANQGNNGLRIFNATANPSSSVVEGITSGYTSNTDYIVSYWTKGAAKTRVFAKNYNGSSWQNNWDTVFTPDGSGWELNTHKIKSNANGEVWWNIYFVENQSDKTAYIDDVSVLTVAQAIENVNAMIDAFDINDSQADKVIKEIEAWVAVLGSGNISKYQEFTDKKAQLEEISKWAAIEGVYGWVTDKASAVSVQTAEVAFDDKALKIEDSNAVVIKPKNIPYGVADSYYTIAFWAKGSGKVNLTVDLENGTTSENIINGDQALENAWKCYVFTDVDIKNGFKLDKLAITFKPQQSGDVMYIDGIQMYRQIGPGSALDTIEVTEIDNTLSFNGIPDGYGAHISKTTDEAVISLDGKISEPQYDTEVRYTFDLTNINDDTDVAFRTLKLTVSGKDGAKPEDESKEELPVRLLTDNESGISVSGKMTSDVKLEVKTLDEESEYYGYLILDGNEVLSFNNIFVVPHSRIDGKLTYNFTVDKKYNGEKLTIARYNKETKHVEEYSAEVKNGIITLTLDGDGAFMVLRELVDAPVNNNHTTNNDTNTPAINEGNVDNIGNTDATDNNEIQNKPNKDENKNSQSNKKADTNGSGNNWLIWLIIGIGILILLLLLVFLLIVLIIRKRRTENS